MISETIKSSEHIRARITVLLLCWNHEAFIEQCFDSLARQSDQSFDVVFLDNRSSDSSWELAQRLAEDLPVPVTLLRNDEPQGISRNFNKLLEASGGEWICPLSTDDWYDDDYIREMRRAMIEDGKTAWLYPSAWEYHEASGQTVAMACDVKFRSGDVAEQALTLNWPFGFLGLCYRRRALVEAGGWDETIPVEDNDLLFRLSLSGHCKHVPKQLVYYRIRHDSASHNLILLSAGWEAFFAKHVRHFPDVRHRLFDYNRIYSAMAVDRGDFSTARMLLLKALTFGAPDWNYLRTLVYYLKARLRSWPSRFSKDPR